jgi:dihydrolipoamide dehydrogenase
MLAHKAEDEGLAVAHRIAGDSCFPPIDHTNVPFVVYTHPELAWVGNINGVAGTQPAGGSNQGVAPMSNQFGSFPFVANSRARATGMSPAEGGMVKVSVDQRSGKLVGAQILGPNAGELIAPMALAIKYGASPLDIADLSVAHPTLTEAVKEACLAAHFKSIHF